MAHYEDRNWTSGDGLRLHFRDYAGPGPDAPARAPVLCLPGLTRNARDFEDLAPRLARPENGIGRRVLCPDFRGRGDSDYAKEPMSYMPAQYAADLGPLLAQEAIGRFVAIGTSLGGLVTMLLAAAEPERIVAAVLNDVGPELEAAGLARIRDYVGQGRAFDTWMHAARALQEAQGDVYPDFELADWLRTAKRLMTVGGGGRIVFDYDMNIADPFEAADQAPPSQAPDMWPLWRTLATRPVLLLRGERSDILSAAAADRMVADAADCTLVTVPRTGHAPTLDEPASVAAIEALLARVA